MENSIVPILKSAPFGGAKEGQRGEKPRGDESETAELLKKEEKISCALQKSAFFNEAEPGPRETASEQRTSAEGAAE